MAKSKAEDPEAAARLARLEDLFNTSVSALCAATGGSEVTVKRALLAALVFESLADSTILGMIAELLQSASESTDSANTCAAGITYGFQCLLKVGRVQAAREAASPTK